MTRTGTLMAVAALAVMLAGCRKSGEQAAGPGEAAIAEAGAGAEQAALIAPGMQGRQMVYPWSVVAGGVDSPLTMRQAMEGDPVVAGHYAGLRPGEFRTERLAENKQGYVSYRIRDQVYWTRKKVTLAAGETVLTDGRAMVRGRCGNLYSATPREPVAAVELEPAEPLMNQPVKMAQLMEMPAIAAETPVETEKFVNPKQMGDGAGGQSLLPPPQAEEPLPPVWVTGGGIGGPGGGVMGVGGGGGGSVGGGGGGGGGEVPGVPEVVVGPPTVPAATAPPMVLVSLLQPPVVGGTPELPSYPVPGAEYPVAPVYPVVPQTFAPPVGRPGENPVPVPPPGESPPPVVPPVVPPPGTPTSGPPPEVPPSGPPPGSPPPVPPGGPPPFDPPGPPPGVAVPEPGAWVLALIGIVAITLGSIRRKNSN